MGLAALEGMWGPQLCVPGGAPAGASWGLGGTPSSSLGVFPCPVKSVLGDTETGWLCIFAQHFIDFLQQTGSELWVRAFPWGGRPLCPLRGGKNHTGWGLGAGVPHLGACVESGWGYVS